jgi:acetyl-CoA carboxylase biotin carboxylase subunit
MSAGRNAVCMVGESRYNRSGGIAAHFRRSIVFRRVLIANRGEIAARVAKTCRQMGIIPVMVYSEADAAAPWIEEADEAVALGPSRSDLSYLNQDRVLQAALQSGCQALHPGYGFLSENARFAARLENSGVTFIGPKPSTILAMGDKNTAKRTMSDAGIPVVPGSPGLVSSPQEALRIASSIGYPILLKATAGGGGKGMRRCDDSGSVERAFEDAAAESEKAFGNAGLYLEKYLEGGRHVEFQLVADGLGAVRCLGERECSIQRKHQKLIEESPSVALSAELRLQTEKRVEHAMRILGYRGVGTVEFLLGPDGDLYFMEVNARLQVEHPVTEMRFGDLDLVEAQLRIAAGEPLPTAIMDLPRSGHAIEFRVNAEDPDNDFRPSPGSIRRLEVPTDVGADARVRWDSGLRQGAVVPPYYDSLIGKLIVHAHDRELALAAAERALDRLVVEGVSTTIPLLRKILRDPDFRAGNYDIRFLEERTDA